MVFTAKTSVMKFHIHIHRVLLVNVVLLAQLVLPASRADLDLKDPQAPLERKVDLWVHIIYDPFCPFALSYG